MMVDTIRHMFIPSIPYVIPYVTSSKTIGMILPMFRATKGLSLMLTDVPKALPSEGLNGVRHFQHMSSVKQSRVDDYTGL